MGSLHHLEYLHVTQLPKSGLLRGPPWTAKKTMMRLGDPLGSRPARIGDPYSKRRSKRMRMRCLNDEGEGEGNQNLEPTHIAIDLEQDPSSQA